MKNLTLCVRPNLIPTFLVEFFAICANKLFTFFDPNQSQRPLIKSPFRTSSAILAYRRYYFKCLFWPIFVTILSKAFEMVLNIFDAVIFVESSHCLRFYKVFVCVSYYKSI